MPARGSLAAPERSPVAVPRERLREVDSHQILSEIVHRCARAVPGEDKDTREASAGPHLHAFRHEGCAAAWRATLRSRAHKQAADRLLHDVGERRDMIQYPEFSAKGRQNRVPARGWGPTESRCKTSTARLLAESQRK